MLKPLPADTFENLFYPPKGYKYFENADPNPLRPQAQGFEPVNAWWMADCSLLAYEQDPDYVRSCLQSAGLETEALLGEWGPGHRGTEGFIASNASVVIVAFRGTEKDDTQDALTDIDVIPCEESGCKVHRGFKLALDQVWAVVTAALERLRGRPVFFTGHSLGAALGSLAAWRWEAGSTLYTYGSPRVGNGSFRDQLLAKTRRIYRVVNCQDAVSQVPLEGPDYTHVGEEKYFDRNHRLNNGLSRLGRWWDGLLGQWGHRRALVEGAPEFFLGNHSPGRYAVLTWNHYASR